ncbi:MAG: hypothetical protein JWM33_2940, partial [Caulobacteraceae bacterium]|nr:hypothetical protein [Caulobacteraceae bacterium]
QWDRMQDLLIAVIRSPAMDMIDLHDRTSWGLAQLILSQAPKADGLIDPTIRAFGWDKNPGGPAGEAVLQRQYELKYLAWLRKGEGKHGAAYRALAKPPKAWRSIVNQTQPLLDAKVRDLLLILQREHQGVLPSLDQAALAWWRKRLSRPHFTPGALIPLLIVPLLMSESPPTWPLAWRIGAYLVGTLAIELAWIYGLGWARLRWEEIDQWQRPAWARAGWAPASLALVWLAALLPAGLVLDIPILFTALLVFLWAFVTGEPDRSYGTGIPWGMSGRRYVPVISLPFIWAMPLWYPRVRIDWRLRALFSFGYLALFLLLVALSFPTWGRLCLAIAAAGASFVWGGQTLYELWTYQLTPKRRRFCLIGLGLITALAPLGLWLISPNISLGPVGVTLVASLVLLHKTPAFALSSWPATARDAVMRYGWIAWYVLAASAATDLNQAQPQLLFGGLWLLTGVGVTVVGALWTERQAARL